MSIKSESQMLVHVYVYEANTRQFVINVSADLVSSNTNYITLLQGMIHLVSTALMNQQLVKLM